MAEPKSASSSPADGSRSPAATITFPCPNGHRISVPAKLAGKRGACSKCGTAVVIPPTSVAMSASTAPSAGRPPVSQTDAFAAGGDPHGGEDGTITLQAPPVWPPPMAPVPSAAVAQPNGVSGGPPSSPTGHAGPPVRGEGALQGGPGSGASDPFAKGALVANPTALLVARLWAERDHGGIVELHLVGGSVILPEWYEAAWSQGSHGLFASQAADGSVTLTAVAWDSIQKVVVRQVEGLPDGMFE